MDEIEPFVDIHCHLLPDLDDGASSWDESLKMARIATSDGVSTVICTPHQMGSYAHIGGDLVRARTEEFQRLLLRHGIPLTVRPGADVRVDLQLVQHIRCGEVLTLADHRKHVLLELPHEVYVPLGNMLDALAQQGITGVLSHPERNQGLLRQPREIDSLVSRGCLMQVTADSFTGAFGRRCEDLAEQMLADGNVHFVATDAHGAQSRRPLLSLAFDRVCALAGSETATDLFCRNPARVAQGRDVSIRPRQPRRRIFFSSWFARRRAG